jgi:hypothetical protein
MHTGRLNLPTLSSCLDSGLGPSVSPQFFDGATRGFVSRRPSTLLQQTQSAASADWAFAFSGPPANGWPPHHHVHDADRAARGDLPRVMKEATN